MKRSDPKRTNLRFVHQQKGSLSITALWMLAVLSLLAVSLMRNVIMGLHLDGTALRANEAAWLARAGIYHAIAVLKHDPGLDSLNSYDAFTEAWAHNPKLFRRVACGNGFFEITYTTPSEDPSLKHLYGICDENRRININKVPAEVLLRLPRMNQEKVAALQDWVDSDSEPRKRGAENGYYQHLSHPYPCKDAELDFVGELALVRGFSDEDIRSLAHLVTVYGDGSVNINTASAEVLALLGLDPELARKILKVRLGSDGLPFTRDDVIFQNSADVVTDLSKRIRIKPSEQVLLNRLIAERLLGVQSTHFTILSVGVTMDGQVRKGISATVYRMSAHQVEIVAWTEKNPL